MTEKSRKSIALNLMRRLKGKQGRRIRARRPYPLFPTNALCKRGALPRNGALTTERTKTMTQNAPTDYSEPPIQISAADRQFLERLADVETGIKKAAATIDRVADGLAEARALHKRLDDPNSPINKAKAVVSALPVADQWQIHVWLTSVFNPL
jgi:hypothetical protein